MRRTFITIAESLDIPYYASKHLANHKDGSDVTVGYIVTNVERLREPMGKISSFIVGKLGVDFKLPNESKKGKASNVVAMRRKSGSS